MKDDVFASGNLTLTLIDSVTGTVKDSRKVKNLVVNIGKEHIASRLIGSTTLMDHMAVGSGTVAPLPTDTTLGTELGRVTFSSAPTQTAQMLTFLASFPAGVGTGAVTEAGIFNAASAGTMLSRTTFLAFNKTATDILNIEWDVTIN